MQLLFRVLARVESFNRLGSVPDVLEVLGALGVDHEVRCEGLVVLLLLLLLPHI